MNFYVDFEATQFSEKIISIGCVAENGNSFYTLVQPIHKAKLSNFITELTGITKEMLKTAPTADEAFVKLSEFVNNNSSKEEKDIFYCYGDSDASFLSHTAKYLTDPTAKEMATYLEQHLVDYMPVVRKFFQSKNGIALRRVYILMQQEDVIQHHDALEDAMMLKEVCDNLVNKCRPEDKEKLASIPSTHRPKSKKRAPEIYRSWSDSFNDRMNMDTLGTKEKYNIKATDDEGNTKYFNSTYTAALWLIKYYIKGISPKKDESIKNIKNKIISAADNNKKYCGFEWRVKNV